MRAISNDIMRVVGEWEVSSYMWLYGLYWRAIEGYKADIIAYVPAYP